MNLFVQKPKYEPVSGLQRLEGENAQFEWLSINDDPQFVMPPGFLLPGWQMLEADIFHNQPSAAVKLYFDLGNGFEEESSVYLPLKLGRITKRLFWMPWGVKAIRFDPLESEGLFSIRHLRFVWLTPWFAHDRLAQRLTRMHYRWRGREKKEVVPSLKQQAQEKGAHWRTLAMAQYNAA